MLDIGIASIAGRRRDNQDRATHFNSPFGHVFLVADGMGGCQGGSIASSMIATRLPGYLCALPESLTPQEALVDSIQTVNREIVEHSRTGDESVEGMGSTLVALLVRHTSEGSVAIGAHAGDSRLYFLRGDRLFCLTEDHTVVRKLVAAGAITAAQAIDHPQASVLTRAVGRIDTLPVDLTSWMLLKPGDIFLLCSDGLSGYASDDSIRSALSRDESAEHLADRLVELALAEQSHDNISVLVIRVMETERG